MAFFFPARYSILNTFQNTKRHKYRINDICWKKNNFWRFCYYYLLQWFWMSAFFSSGLPFFSFFIIVYFNDLNERFFLTVRVKYSWQKLSLIQKKAYFLVSFFFKHKKSVKSFFFQQIPLMRYFCLFVFWKVLRIEYIAPEYFRMTFNSFVFFCFHVLNLFVGWGVLIWKDVAFWDMALFHSAISFRNKVGGKKKPCSFILSLCLTKKVFLDCAKKKKYSKKTKKCK